MEELQVVGGGELGTLLDLGEDLLPLPGGPSGPLVEGGLVHVDDEIVVLVLPQEVPVLEILGDLAPDVLSAVVHRGDHIAVHDVLLGTCAVELVAVIVELPSEVLGHLGGEIVLLLDEEHADLRFGLLLLEHL